MKILSVIIIIFYFWIAEFQSQGANSVITILKYGDPFFNHKEIISPEGFLGDWVEVDAGAEGRVSISLKHQEDGERSGGFEKHLSAEFFWEEGGVKKRSELLAAFFTKNKQLYMDLYNGNYPDLSWGFNFQVNCHYLFRVSQKDDKGFKLEALKHFGREELENWEGRVRSLRLKSGVVVVGGGEDLWNAIMTIERESGAFMDFGVFKIRQN